MPQTKDIIDLDQISSLAALLGERVERSPDAIAYRYYDRNTDEWSNIDWEQFAIEVCRWQAALLKEDLNAGDRIAIMAANGPEWSACDMAAHGLGLVMVPLYVNDRAENISLVLEDCGARLLVVGGPEQWQALTAVHDTLSGLQRIVAVAPVVAEASGPKPLALQDWLPVKHDALRVEPIDSNALATIVYTSGTTGRPKGVMLSHRNILFNVQGVLERVHAYREDTFLSFLPLSHMLERTCGYYLPMAAGATVAYARSAKQLAEDLETIRPTVIISVPRVFERMYTGINRRMSELPFAKRVFLRELVKAGWKHFQYEQGRGRWSPDVSIWKKIDDKMGEKIRYKLGGKLRAAVTGGAALSPEIAQFFIGLGLPILQGYGATETSPVVSTNTMENNRPDSIGIPLPGVEVRIGEGDELLTRSPSVMLGYWNNPEATNHSIDAQGWFHTGDCARIEDKHLFITGRIKEIIVMANGEKVPPGDMESAIMLDRLFLQAIVLGEARPYLTALVVLNEREYAELAAATGLSADIAVVRNSEKLEQQLVKRIAYRLSDFPGYAKIPRVGVIEKPWSVEDGYMTPTLKLRRAKILQAFGDEVERLYAGH
jgi:long-chain acyl-CoA synthetase